MDTVNKLLGQTKAVSKRKAEEDEKPSRPVPPGTLEPSAVAGAQAPARHSFQGPWKKRGPRAFRYPLPS